MDTDSELISRLKFISKIKAGEKINVRYLFKSHNDWQTSLSRTFYYKDNRTNTLDFIKRVVNGAFRIIKSNKNSENEFERTMCINIIKDLKKSKDGIEALKKTYIEDEGFCSDIETLIQEMDAKLEALQKEDVFSGVLEKIEEDSE